MMDFKIVFIILVCFLNMPMITGLIYNLMAVNHCKNQDYSLKFFATIKERKNDGNHVLDINFTLPFDIGDNTLVKSKVDKQVGSKWVQAFKFDDRKGLCVFMSTYLGPMWTTIRKSAGLSATCPWKKGTYFLRDYRLKIEIPIPRSMSLGNLKFLEKIVEKNTNKELLCMNVQLNEVQR